MESAPRNWRSIAKALILVEHLTKHGAEKVVGDVQQHIHDINALAEFRYYEGHLDRGSGGAARGNISRPCISTTFVLLIRRSAVAHIELYVLAAWLMKQ